MRISSILLSELSVASISASLRCTSGILCRSALGLGLQIARFGGDPVSLGLQMCLLAGQAGAIGQVAVVSGDAVEVADPFRVIGQNPLLAALTEGCPPRGVRGPRATLGWFEHGQVRGERSP